MERSKTQRKRSRSRNSAYSSWTPRKGPFKPEKPHVAQEQQQLKSLKGSSSSSKNLLETALKMYVQVHASSVFPTPGEVNLSALLSGVDEKVDIIDFSSPAFCESLLCVIEACLSSQESFCLRRMDVSSNGVKSIAPLLRALISHNLHVDLEVLIAEDNAIEADLGFIELLRSFPHLTEVSFQGNSGLQGAERYVESLTARLLMLRVLDRHSVKERPALALPSPIHRDLTAAPESLAILCFIEKAVFEPALTCTEASDTLLQSSYALDCVFRVSCEPRALTPVPCTVPAVVRRVVDADWAQLKEKVGSAQCSSGSTATFHLLRRTLFTPSFTILQQVVPDAAVSVLEVSVPPLVVLTVHGTLTWTHILEPASQCAAYFDRTLVLRNVGSPNAVRWVVSTDMLHLRQRINEDGPLFYADSPTRLRRLAALHPSIPSDAVLHMARTATSDLELMRALETSVL